MHNPGVYSELLFCCVNLPEPRGVTARSTMALLGSFAVSGAAVFSRWHLCLISQRFTPVANILHISLDVSKSRVH